MGDSACILGSMVTLLSLLPQMACQLLSTVLEEYLPHNLSRQPTSLVHVNLVHVKFQPSEI